MENRPAPSRAPERKAFVLVTIAPPQAIMDEIGGMSSGAQDFALDVWKRDNRIITWACPELADRIVPEEREGLQKLLTALGDGTFPESRIVGPDYSSFMMATGNAIAPVRETQKVSFARPIGVPLEITARDDYGRMWKGVAELSKEFNMRNVVGQWLAAFKATDLTGQFPERSLGAVLGVVEKPAAAASAFVYDV